MTSGVSQRSLFAVYIIDLDESIGRVISKFMNGTKIDGVVDKR